MTSGWLWALGACAGASSVLASGCGEVESCKELDEGCLGGVPDESGNCRFGLVPNDDLTACVRKGDESSSSDGGVTPGNCSCPNGQLCQSNGSCVDVCKTPSNLPAPKPTLPTCRPGAGEPAYDFATAAVSLCYQGCTHRAEYCGGTCDPTKDCTAVAATALAATVCPGMAVECAMLACEKQRDMPCASQNCPGMAAPNCAGVACTNKCQNPAFNNDGICDDADLSNAESGVCDWGTDCGDCGPRRGTAPAFSVQLGDPCIDPLQCGGNVDSIAKSTGWCLLPDDREPRRCLPDCSVKGKKCPAGFSCSPLMQTGASGSPEPVQDATGLAASACFPTQCGN
ncbi:MAG: hypothetical protein JWN48_2086 [Myxococcaceae bacterium]|nr:hypothetical protein [Myxococcaceae bacterium]